MKKIHTRKRPAPSSPSASPISSKLTLAELSLQRGEYDKARRILEKRLGQGHVDFKTRNLFGISLVNMGRYERAIAIFRELKEGFKVKPLGNKAGFNLGLTYFYRDLSQLGDLSVTRYRRPAVGLTVPPSISARPFAEAINTWTSLLKGRPRYRDVIATYLSFAHLQSGDLDQALKCLIEALSLHESFFVTHYVLGRIFLDLYYLAEESNNFPVNQGVLEFFEIAEYEVLNKKDGRFFIHQATLLDIAMQGFIEARVLNPLCTEVLLNLCHTFLLAQMFEEAQDTLAQAETIAPDALSTLETSLTFHEIVQAPPDIVKTLVNRIKSTPPIEPADQVYNIMPPYYLF